MSDYHGCKEEVINLYHTIWYYLQNVKDITFRKMSIIPNVNKLMLLVIFIFSDWILTEQMIVSSTPSALGVTDFQNILPGVLSGGLGHEWKSIDSMIL